MRRRQMMQKVSRISLCVVIGLLFLALIWKFAGAQLAKKGIVLSNDTAAKTVSETAPEAEDGSGNAGIKKLAETTPPNETPGWQYSSSGWWYATDATTYYVNGWADIDGNQYHFDSNGYMATGWKAIGGKGCYFDDQGVYQPDRNGSMMVALTFDDGPGVYTSTLLDTLEQYGAQATFFMLGSNVEKYGADTLRMYEMFLGPVEQSKPWDTNGIDGVHRFLKKLWNLFYSRTDEFLPVESEPTKEELKAIHKLIKKVTGDIETFSYNTSISAFMICVNELTSLKCRNKEVLSNLIILLAPFAPHYAEELWEALGNTTSVCDAQWPAFNEDYLKEDTVKYTISFNGKARFTMEFATDADNNTIQATVMANEQAQKWIEGKTPKKVIIVPKKIVNIVL